MKTWNDLNADEFYARRDERTLTLVNEGVLAQARLKLSIDHAEAHTFAGQLAFLLLVNLNARWCRNIQIVGPDIELHPDLVQFFGQHRLLEAASWLAGAIDPFGCLAIGEIEEGGSTRRVWLHVGVSSPEGAYPLMGRGWQAGAGSWLVGSPLQGEERNPLGASLVAAIGTCYAMRQSIGHLNVFSDVNLSQWNYRENESASDGPLLKSTSLGRLLIVGTGAIGSGIAYLLPLLHQKAKEVVVVDEDDIDYPNLNRAPVFLAQDVGAKKVQVVAAHLRQNDLPVHSIPTWFDGKEISMADFDFIVPAANEHGVRESIMHNFPPLMISASTGSQWDTYRQRHIPTRDDCLICRFPPRPDTAVLACSTGDVGPVKSDNNASEETGALPFLSFSGAVMALADIAKLAYEGYPHDDNSTSLWFKSPSLRFTNTIKEPRFGCSYCVDPELLVALNRQGMYAHLSALTQ